MPRFNRYEGGGKYDFHVYGAVKSLPDRDELRGDVSCTLLLGEQEEYVGGELIVSDTYGEHEVNLPAGDIIVHHSSSLHRVVAFFWVKSLVRDDGERRLLFELDTTIKRLVATVADSDAVLLLSGTYHNLLRQQAES